MNKVKTKYSSSKSPIALVCPDATTGNFVLNTLKNEGLVPDIQAIGKQESSRLSKNGLGSDDTVLLLVPSMKLGMEQLNLVKRTVLTGGQVLAWQSCELASNNSQSDEWLMARFVEQAGALCTSNLSVAIEAVRIAACLGLPAPEKIRLKGAASGLGLRLEMILKSFGMEPTKRGGGSWTIDLKDKPLLCSDSKTCIEFKDPSVLAEALSLLRDYKLDAESKDTKVEPNTQVLNSIVRPPARLLSETTSKRVISCVGIEQTKEQLCKSPTNAVQFASSIEGPVVAKLVMPALTGKTDARAVQMNIEGPSAVRRAVLTLESVASDLAPPRALGVLVAKQVNGGDRIWVKMGEDPKLGRFLLVGAGDSPSTDPLTALKIPVTGKQAKTALKRYGLATSTKKSQTLGTSIARFSSLLMEVGQRVERAEIHPLVALDNAAEALALDALIGIAADVQPER